MPAPDIDYFLPYQRRWIAAGEPFVVGEKSRRIGWTYASAYRAVQRRLERKTHLYYTSTDLTAAREFVDYCMHWARVHQAVAEDLGTQVIDEQAGITAFVLRFKINGARIVAGSSNPKFFRSKGGDADADEFAFHADPRGLLKAMHVTAMVWGHQLRLWSTHNGEGSYFNRLVQSAGVGATLVSPSSEDGQQRARQVSPLQVQRVTILDAVEQGLVERIKGLSEPDPVARRDWLEELRASCPDEDTWNEEYLCRPSSEQAALLNYPLIEACEVGAGSEPALVPSEEIGPPGQEGRVSNPPLHCTGGPCYAGFDVGRKHDRSVLWVLERVGDVFWTRVLRVMHDVSFTAQEQLLVALMNDRRVKRLCVDSTGIGAMLAERLRQRFGPARVEGVHFSAPVKSELAMPLLRLFQDRLVRVPADPAVREDLHKVRKTVTAAGNVRLDAARDDQTGHADRFWALALAYHAADDVKVRWPVRSLAVKPLDW